MRWIAGTIGGLLALVAAGALFLVAEAGWGPLVALAVLVAPLLLMPALLTKLTLRDEDAWRPSASVRKWSRHVVATSGLLLVVLAATGRISVADALSRLPDRHPALGPVARAAARVGHALEPPQGSASAAPPNSPAPPSTPPPAGSAAPPSPAPAPTPARAPAAK